jgi:hypothetical protein
MIQGQIGRMKSVVAILTLILVPQEHMATGKGGPLIDMLDIIRQGNDTRQRNFQIDGTNCNIGIHIHHCHLATKNGLDGILPRPKTEGKVTEGLLMLSTRKRHKTK